MNTEGSGSQSGTTFKALGGPHEGRDLSLLIDENQFTDNIILRYGLSG